jgi:succinyl-CoA synthetase alpha subunit
MGHAGAIISGGKGTPEAKIKALQAAGVDVADRPDEIPGLLLKKLTARPA